MSVIGEKRQSSIRIIYNHNVNVYEQHITRWHNNFRGKEQHRFIGFNRILINTTPLCVCLNASQGRSSIVSLNITFQRFGLVHCRTSYLGSLSFRLLTILLMLACGETSVFAQALPQDTFEAQRERFLEVEKKLKNHAFTKFR